MGQPLGDLYTRVLKCCQIAPQGCTVLNFDKQLQACVCLCCTGDTSDGAPRPCRCLGYSRSHSGPFGALSSATGSLKSHLLHPHTVSHVQISIAGYTEAQKTQLCVSCLIRYIACLMTSGKWQHVWWKPFFRNRAIRVKEEHYWRQKRKQH